MGDVKKEISSNNRSAKTRPRKKFTKNDLYGVTRDPEYWITELELFRGD